MEPKKVSFGFSKINKKVNLLSNKPLEKTENKVELIKCVEGQSIQLVQEKEEEKPLVIPLKESRKTSAALASLLKRQSVLNGEENEEVDTPEGANGIGTDAPVPLGESIEQRAARELLAETQAKNSGDVEENSLVLPLKPEDVPLDGAVEPTIDDYESIPISQFGLAMLRGMGWKEEPKKKKSPKDSEGPVQRPKGMGLGADKAVKAKPLLVQPEANETLELRKNAFVRILGGKHKDLYGQIEGLDDHAGRVIVKLALGGNREALNEFLVQPVSKKEYAQYGKVINSAKYEEYKKLENERGQIVIKKEERDEPKVKKEDESRREESRVKPDSRYDEPARRSRSHERTRPSAKYSSSRDHTSSKSRSRRRSSSTESSSSDSTSYRHKKKSSKSKKSKDRHRSRHDSSDDEKRHKKKTKKSKKQRSRSRSKGRR